MDIWHEFKLPSIKNGIADLKKSTIPLACRRKRMGIELFSQFSNESMNPAPCNDSHHLKPLVFFAFFRFPTLFAENRSISPAHFSRD